jgi:hypothetical protein
VIVQHIDKSTGNKITTCIATHVGQQQPQLHLDQLWALPLWLLDLPQAMPLQHLELHQLELQRQINASWSSAAQTSETKMSRQL